MHKKSLLPVMGVLFGMATAPVFGAVPHAAQSAKGIRSFGFELFKSLYDAKGKEPVAISPLSISEAMTLVTAGAEKDTLTELESLFSMKNDSMVKGVQALRTELSNYASVSAGAFEFSSANALWGNSNPDYAFEFTPNFKKLAVGSFGASLHKGNFQVPTTVGEINAWVEKATKAKIKKLIAKLESTDVAVLLNAIYAKGRFASHFHSLSEADYTNASGVTSKATYMTNKTHYNYYEDADLKAVSLAIGDNRSKAPANQIALDILVPEKGNLDSLVAVLDGSKYADVVSKMASQELNLSITAGKVEQGASASLMDSLKAAPFRLSRSFDRDRAEFASLGSTKGKHRLFISDVLTKTFYEVTPFGFEAAAATAVLMGAATSVRLPPPAVSISGPSIHVIRHVPTGTPLFISVYDSPVLYDVAKIVELIEVGEATSRHLVAQTAQGRIHASLNRAGKRSIVLSNERGELLKVLKTLK